MNDLSTEDDTVVSQSVLRILTKWSIFLGASLSGVMFFGFALYGMLFEEWVEQAAKEHFAAMVGLPCAALASLFLVTVLEIRSGNVEITIGALQFKGATGPIIMWIMSFAVMTWAIHLLW
jgi:hypothetical protein